VVKKHYILSVPAFYKSIATAYEYVFIFFSKMFIKLRTILKFTIHLSINSDTLSYILQKTTSKGTLLSQLINEWWNGEVLRRYFWIGWSPMGWSLN